MERRTTDSGALEMHAEYRYDVFGLRKAKVVDNDGDGTTDLTQRYALDGWDVIADLDASSSLTSRYLRTDIVDHLFARLESDGLAFWDYTDHLGSIRDITDSGGVVVDALTYDAFGNILAETEASYRGRYAWTGRELDVETGLQYNRARYYDAATGRWLSQDPLGFGAGDSNLYRYVNNRPIIEVDPSGFWNLWNPLTWGTGNPSTDRWYNKINPFGQSAQWGATVLGVKEGIATGPARFNSGWQKIRGDNQTGVDIFVKGVARRTWGAVGAVPEAGFIIHDAGQAGLYWASGKRYKPYLISDYSAASLEAAKTGQQWELWGKTSLNLVSFGAHERTGSLIIAVQEVEQTGEWAPLWNWSGETTVDAFGWAVVLKHRAGQKVPTNDFLRNPGRTWGQIRRFWQDESGTLYLPGGSGPAPAGSGLPLVEPPGGPVLQTPVRWRAGPRVCPPRTNAPVGATSRLVPGGGLAAHEAAGGHTIARHVGRTDAQLAARLTAEPNIPAASTFANRAAAESAIAQTLDANAGNIGTWLSGTGNQLVVTHTLPPGSAAGSTLIRGAANPTAASSVRIVLRRDPSMPGGYRIHTAYPE